MSGRGTVMVRHGDCPPWCAEHAAGPDGGEHRAVIGDVRLTLIGDAGVRRVICAVRRRAARTPAEMAELAADLIAAADLLRGRRRLLHGDDRRLWAAALLATV